MVKNIPSQLHLSLFSRGYLLTNRDSVVEEKVPVLQQWRKQGFRSFTLYIHPDSDYYLYEKDQVLWLLIGHAYNPWSSEASEKAILQILSEKIQQSEISFYEYLDQLTGRFAIFKFNDDGSGFVLQDAVGLKNVYYNKTNSKEISFSSHSQLLADACSLDRDPDVTRLVNSFFYGLGVRHLPGLRSPFREVGMVGANTLLHFPEWRLERFFPREPHPESDDLISLAADIGEVKRRSFDLLTKKKSLAVSLSFGTDSRVTLASSRDYRNEIHYFSYSSDAAEQSDAEKASHMCRQLGIDHHSYPVPVEELKATAELAEFSKLVEHNSAYVRKPKIGELAKLYHLHHNFPKGHLEVKTHVSEIGRCFYSKKTGRFFMPAQLIPRHMSNYYKRNLMNRSMLRFMDQAFQEFIEQTGFGNEFYNYDQSDMFYWEHRMPAWGSLANQDHDIIHDMTSLFNNRELLKLFLAPSRQHRINDDLHREVIRYLWPETLNFPLGKPENFKNKVRKAGERVFFAVNRF